MHTNNFSLKVKQQISASKTNSKILVFQIPCAPEKAFKNPKRLTKVFIRDFGRLRKFLRKKSSPYFFDVLMEDILHQLRLVAYPIISRVWYISGGDRWISAINDRIHHQVTSTSEQWNFHPGCLGYISRVMTPRDSERTWDPRKW